MGEWKRVNGELDHRQDKRFRPLQGWLIPRTISVDWAIDYALGGSLSRGKRIAGELIKPWIKLGGITIYREIGFPYNRREEKPGYAWRETRGLLAEKAFVSELRGFLTPPRTSIGGLTLSQRNKIMGCDKKRCLLLGVLNYFHLW